MLWKELWNFSPVASLWKTLICRETTVMETIFRKVQIIQNGLMWGRLSINFPNTFIWLLPNIQQKLIPLKDIIVWCKHSRVIKDLSKSGSFFLLNAPKYLGARLFILSTCKLYVFSEIIGFALKKNPWNVKVFFVKKSPLRFS